MSGKPDAIARKEGAAPGGRSGGGRRRAARLGAVQALYEIEISGAAPDPVLTDFLARRWTMNAAADGPAAAAPAEGDALADPDVPFLSELVRGVSASAPSLDGRIGPCLEGDWTVERLEVLLRAILRAGAYELANRIDVPAETVISEYVDVAHAFFAGREPALVNAVLDRLARALRPGELDGKAETIR